ncbi:MAG: SMC-Scp complex subunit ScpB [bacterium]
MSEEPDSGYTDEEVNLDEAVLFAAPKSLSREELKKIIKSRHRGGIRSIVEKLNERYDQAGISFRIREIAGGYQFFLTEPYSLDVERHLARQRKRRLTPAGLETLAIIAYRQPVTKAEVEHIRGVACDGVLQTLLERNLVKPAGRAERIGRPLLYATTTEFLEYFGIDSLEQLPKLEEVLPRQLNSPAQGSLTFDLDDSVEAESAPLSEPDTEP